MNNPDPRISYVTALLSEEKYRLTVDMFARSLTSRGSWLVQFVPKAILAYHEKRLQQMQQELMARLKGASAEEQVSIMNQMNRVSEARRKVNIRLGREKTKKRYGE